MVKQLSFKIKLGWAIGELAIAAFVVLQMSYMLYFCTEALKLPPAISGLALLLPRLLDSIADPFMGALSDRTKSKFGRRRIYLLLGAPLLGISFASVFFVPHDAPIAIRIGLLLLSFLLSNAAVTIYEVPYSALAAEMSQSYKERTILAGYKMFAARLGGVVAAFAAPSIFGSQETLQEGFKLLGISAGIFMIVTGLWTFFATKNAPQIDKTAHKFSVKDELDAVLNNQSFRKLWSAFFVQNLAIGASATTLIYFLTNIVAIAPKSAGQFMVAGAVSALIATPLWVNFAKKIGKPKGYVIAICGAIIMAIPSLFINPDLVWALIPILIVVGIFDAATQLFPNAMIPDTVEIDELRTGQRREGAIFGAWGFARKLGMTGGAFLVSQLFAIIGFVPGLAASMQSQTALNGIRIIYAVLPICLWLLALYLFSKYDLDETKFDEIKRKIQERDA